MSTVACAHADDIKPVRTVDGGDKNELQVEMAGDSKGMLTQTDWKL